MCIFDIIKKLENIKHSYLIYALEKYTDQITKDEIKKREDDIKKKTADDIKKRELERATQDELARSDVKKPADDVKKLANDVKKPADDVKKPADDVKKFENNIMDSLKWVFISIGILIFLIFVGGLIYWGLYGDGGNNDEYNTRIIENQYIAPTNHAKQYIAPTNNANQYIAPTNNTNQYIAPTNVEDKEGSIFSFLSPFSKKEKKSEIEAISKTKAQLDDEKYLESIKQSRTKQQLNNSMDSSLESKSNLQTKTKAQLDAEEYLESIKQSLKKQHLDTNKINEDNLPKLLSSSIKDDNNVRIQKV